jgi:hypothetical protein
MNRYVYLVTHPRASPDSGEPPAGAVGNRRSGPDNTGRTGATDWGQRSVANRSAPAQTCGSRASDANGSETMQEPGPNGRHIGSETANA